MNYETARGAEAFERIKVFEGVPRKYSNRPKVVAVSNERPIPPLGAIETTFGWKYGQIVQDLEVARIEESKKKWKQKKGKAKRIGGLLQIANKQLVRAYFSRIGPKAKSSVITG